MRKIILTFAALGGLVLALGPTSSSFGAKEGNGFDNADIQGTYIWNGTIYARQRNNGVFAITDIVPALWLFTADGAGHWFLSDPSVSPPKVFDSGTYTVRQNGTGIMDDDNGSRHMIFIMRNRNVIDVNQNYQKSYDVIGATLTKQQ